METTTSTINNVAYTSTMTYRVRNSADTPEPVAGQIKLPIARTDGKKGKSGLCIVVNEVSDSVVSLIFNSESGKQWIVGHVNGLRSKIGSEINKAGGIISSDKIGVDALLKAITTEVQTTRFSKESIAAWCDAELRVYLATAIQSKLVGISADKLAKLLEGYKADMQLLAAREVMISKEMRSKLEKALALLPSDYSHPIAEKLAEKLATEFVPLDDVL